MNIFIYSHLATIIVIQLSDKVFIRLREWEISLPQGIDMRTRAHGIQYEVWAFITPVAARRYSEVM